MSDVLWVQNFVQSLAEYQFVSLRDLRVLEIQYRMKRKKVLVPRGLDAVLPRNALACDLGEPGP